MAKRTTPDEVKKIMVGCDLENPTIDAYIIGANLVIDEVFAGDTDVGSDLLQELERWFTAHMIASTSWRLSKREKVGDAEIEYTGVFGKDLDMTPYGQMVKQLDTTGKMMNIGKRAATVYAIPNFD